MSVVLVACGRGKKPPSGQKKESSANEALLSKLEGYIECLEHTKRVFQISDVYRERFTTAPPTPETDIALQPPSDPKKCIEGIATSRLLPPALPELEAAGDAYASALTAVFTLTTSGHDFYDRASKDYAPAKGIALHPQLLAAFLAFDAAQGSLFDQVYRLNRSVRLDELARREKVEGRKFGVVGNDMMLRADDLVQFAATRWDHLDKIDLVAMTDRIRRFESSLEEMTAYHLAHSNEVDAIKGFWALTNRTRAYLISAKQLANRARDKLAFTDAERIMIASNNERSVIGSPAAMIDAFNEVVIAYGPVGSQ